MLLLHGGVIEVENLFFFRCPWCCTSRIGSTKQCPWLGQSSLTRSSTTVKPGGQRGK